MLPSGREIEEMSAEDRAALFNRISGAEKKSAQSAWHSYRWKKKKDANIIKSKNNGKVQAMKRANDPETPTWFPPKPSSVIDRTRTEVVPDDVSFASLKKEKFQFNKKGTEAEMDSQDLPDNLKWFNEAELEKDAQLEAEELVDSLINTEEVNDVNDDVIAKGKQDLSKQEEQPLFKLKPEVMEARKREIDEMIAAKNTVNKAVAKAEPQRVIKLAGITAQQFVTTVIKIELGALEITMVGEVMVDLDKVMSVLRDEVVATATALVEQHAEKLY